MTINISTTVTNNNITSKKLNTDELNTRTVVIDGKTISNIVDKIVTPSREDVPNTLALALHNEGISDTLREFKKLLDSFATASSISPPIISPYFFDCTTWEKTDGIKFIDGKAIYQSTNSTNKEELRISSVHFSKLGRYFIEINISQLTTGLFIVYNENREEVFTITEQGTFAFETNVTELDSALLLFVCSNVFTNDMIVVDSVFVYHIEDSLDKYFDYKAVNISTGGSSLVSIEKLKQELVVLENKLKLYNAMNRAHIEDTTGNPHMISPAMIHAANEIHTHYKNSIIDFEHKHTSSDLTDLTSLTQTIADLISGDISAVGDALAAHKLEDNPHNISRFTVELENVDNFYTATTTEAIDGAEQRFVEPARVHEIFNSRIAVLDTDKIVTSHPMNVHKIKLDTTVKIMINPVSSYTLKINTLNDSLKNLGFKFSNSNISYSNHIFMGRQSDADAGWFSEISTMFKLPSTVGLTNATGVFTIYPSFGFVKGSFISKNALNVDIPWTFNGKYTHDNSLAGVYLELFPIVNTDAFDIDLEIVENKITSADPSFMMDSTSVGTVQSMINNIPPEGWGVLDGSTVDRTRNIELYELAHSQNLIVPYDQYQEILLDQGFCSFFTYENDHSFILPTYPSSYFGGVTKTMIKMRSTNVSEATRLIYRYIWS